MKSLFFFFITYVSIFFQFCMSLTCDMKEYGAHGNGIDYDDDALQKALVDCNDGTIYFPPGSYLLSPFNFTNNLELYLEEGSILLATTDVDKWPLVEALPSYPDSYGGIRRGPFIGGNYVNNIRIRGKGTIDGQGKAWWDAADNHTLQYDRPRLIEPMYCTNFEISGITVINPPFWAIHPFACDGVLVENLNFSAPITSPNTDGVDPDSCSNVIIRNLTATCGDDAVAIKSGKDEFGRAFNRPSYNILVEGGLIGPSSGIDIGSEMSGDVFNVLVRNVHFKGSLFATRIKSGRGRGGVVHNVTFEDLTMENNVVGVAITMHYSDEDPTPPTDEATPHIRDITYRRIYGSALTAGAFACLAESACRGLVFDNINITSRVGGFECVHTFGESVGDVMIPDACF